MSLSNTTELSTHLQTPLLSVSLILVVRCSSMAALTDVYQARTSWTVLSSELIFSLEIKKKSSEAKLTVVVMRLLKNKSSKFISGVAYAGTDSFKLWWIWKDHSIWNTLGRDVKNCLNKEWAIQIWISLGNISNGKPKRNFSIWRKKSEKRK